MRPGGGNSWARRYRSRWLYAVITWDASVVAVPAFLPSMTIYWIYSSGSLLARTLVIVYRVFSSLDMATNGASRKRFSSSVHQRSILVLIPALVVAEHSSMYQRSALPMRHLSRFLAITSESLLEALTRSLAVNKNTLWYINLPSLDSTSFRSFSGSKYPRSEARNRSCWTMGGGRGVAEACWGEIAPKSYWNCSGVKPTILPLPLLLLLLLAITVLSGARVILLMVCLV